MMLDPTCIVQPGEAGVASFSWRTILIGPLVVFSLSCAATGTQRSADELPAPTTGRSTQTTAAQGTTRATSAPTSAAFTVEITQSRYGSIVAQTAVGARCSASARLPSGRDSTAQGLSVDSVADGSGRVSWTYGTSGNTNPGTGTHTVRCMHQGQTKTTTGSFRV
jgi:hypothetical protein